MHVFAKKIAYFVKRSSFLVLTGNRILRAVFELSVLLICGGAFAGAFPEDAGLINVRSYGALGDGVTDDTAAIRAAISAAQIGQGRYSWPSKLVYLPAGTYRVTDTLYAKDVANNFLSGLALQGDSKSTTTIKLDDYALGYNKADSPKAVIFTSSKLIDKGGGRDYAGKGEGNDAYGNYVQDLTVDVGRGNAGAVGIDFLASNFGAIRNVAVSAADGSGRIGISMERKWPGPLLLSGVEINGFSIGISVSQPEYSVTIVATQLRRQTEAGIRNIGNSVQLQDVKIATENGPAIQNLGVEGLVVADDVSITPAPASKVWLDNRGYFTIGRSSVLLSSAVESSDLQRAVTGAYFKSDPISGFNANWRIPHLSPPPAWNPPFSDWVSVTKFGAQPNSVDDASPAIRAAFASGASVVYFPSGIYHISEQVVVPRSVRRIVGMQSAIYIANRSAGFSRDSGMFAAKTDGESLTIESLALDNTNLGRQVGLELAGGRSLVLRDFITAGVSLQRSASGGPFFLENVCCGFLRVAGTSGVWARQFNAEGSSVRVTNDGSPMSIVGLKVEGNAIVVENLPGANTEILGGLIYQVRPVSINKPAFINHEGARLFVSYAEEAYLPNSFYLEHVVEKSRDSSSSVTAESLPRRKPLARLMPGMSFPGETGPLKRSP